MPSINDVYNKLQDISATLSTLHNDASDLKTLAGQINQTLNTRLGQIDSTLTSGFGNLSQGLLAMIVQQNYANKALTEIVQQEKTMICQLEQISHHTCDILSEAHFQTGLQRHIDGELNWLLQIARTVHAAADLEYRRLQDMKKEIERCCPPEQEKPICTHVPCPQPPDMRLDVPPVTYRPTQEKLEPPR